MAIKFGDTLENQNTNYPIVDVVGDNVAGVHVVDDFANDHLINIPSNARRTGSIVVAKDTGKVYIFKGTGAKLTTDTNNNDNWGHAAGANWVKAGDTTLGSPSDGDWTDNSPAVGLNDNTSIADAIDLLNETLGALVPTAPSTWANQDDNLAFSVGTTNARLVGKNTLGAAITHVVNGNTATTTPGTAVDWYQGVTSINFSKTFNFTDNDQEQTQFRFHLNDEVVSLESATDTSQTLAADDNAYGGTLTITVTTGDFPNDGSSSQGFYTGVASVATAANNTVSSGVNILKFDDVGGNNPITQEFYRAATEDSADFNTTGNSCQLTKTADGTIGYTSGLPCFTNPTWSLKVSTTNIIPDAALVYGATTSTTDNNCVTFADGDVAAAPTNPLTYNDLPNSTNSNVQQGDDFSNHTISDLATRADQYRAINMRLTGGPQMTAKSLHGDSSATEVGVDSGTGNKIYYFYDQPDNSDSLLAVFENNLYNTIHSSNTAGVRVQDPDTDGNAEATPADAVSAYGPWSQQYGNSTSSLSLKAQDAITAPKLATGTTNLLRCAHDVTNYTASTNFFADTPSNFSTRTSSNAQYVTYAFPCDQTIASFTLKFKGDLDGGGDLWFKIFDDVAGVTNSLEDANSSTGGWVPATVAYAGAGIAGAGGTGCASGGNLSKTTTSLQTITITAGSGRWNNGSDNNVYVRIKLTAGDFVEQLGLLEI